MERNCVDCGKPSKTFTRCYPCKMKKEGKVNNCKHCGKECGTYASCFKCFKIAKEVEESRKKIDFTKLLDIKDIKEDFKEYKRQLDSDEKPRRKRRAPELSD